MPQIYITDETKALLEKVANSDRRTKDGEILYLLEERQKQIGILPEQTPRHVEINGTADGQGSQE